MTDRVLVGYDDCRCILTQYCDGNCRPVYAHRPLRASSPPVPQQGAEAVAWEAPQGYGIKRFVSERQYRRFSPKIQAWYKPYRCASCASPDAVDAARYRLLRSFNWDSSDLFVVAGKSQEVLRLGTYCPSGLLLDQALDDRMPKEGS